MISSNLATLPTTRQVSQPQPAPARREAINEDAISSSGLTTSEALALAEAALRDEMEALASTPAGLTNAPSTTVLPNSEPAHDEVDIAALARCVAGNQAADPAIHPAPTTTTAPPATSPTVVSLPRASMGPGNINAQVQFVLRDAYLEVTQDLYLYADKVRFYNDVKKAIRGELNRANQAMAKTAGQEDDARLNPPFQSQPIDTDYAGQPFVQPPPIQTEEVTGPELNPLVQTVLDGMRELLPSIIRHLILQKNPNAGPIADQAVETVLKLIDGFEAGTLNLQTALRTIVEGVYDLLPTVLPHLVKAYFPQAAAVPGLPEAITNMVMGFLPDPGAGLVDDDESTIDTKADLEAYIKKLEEDLSSVGDDAQLANVDLQNILQKQQQLIQMLSNISKMLHDSALAVVRKVGA